MWAHCQWHREKDKEQLLHHTAWRALAMAATAAPARRRRRRSSATAHGGCGKQRRRQRRSRPTLWRSTELRDGVEMAHDDERRTPELR